MSKTKNVIVAQSGGPTLVINNSVRGVVETRKTHSNKIRTMFAGCHGVEGMIISQKLTI